MAKCIYCGEDAGILKDRHGECQEKMENGFLQINQLVTRALSGDQDIETLKDKIDKIAAYCHVPPPDIQELIISKWENAVQIYLTDGVLDKNEDERLIELQDRFHLDQSDLDRSGAFMNMAKASILRDILNGEYPRRKIVITGPNVPNLHKAESAIWVFNPAKLYEEKIHRKQVGATKGISVRIMKGVYYRFGAFEGKSIEEEKMELFDIGVATFTNKHIYFIGPDKSKRIPFSKIISYHPFDDGIGFDLDAASSKHMVLQTGDGWFTYNLVMNIGNL